MHLSLVYARIYNYFITNLSENKFKLIHLVINKKKNSKFFKISLKNKIKYLSSKYVSITKLNLELAPKGVKGTMCANKLLNQLTITSSKRQTDYSCQEPKGAQQLKSFTQSPYD